MSETTHTEGTLDTRADAGRDARGVVRFWLDQIEIASLQEAEWRDDAAKAEEVYKGGTGEGRLRWNILYSNTETLAAAIYNSTPMPDIRRRFNDGNESARVIATALERVVSFCQDEYDPDAVYRKVVKDGLIAGRGIPRVKVKDLGEAAPDYQSVTCSVVDWRCFRHGAAKDWSDIPWIAFRHFLPREELVKINPRLGASLKLGHEVPEGQKKRDNGDNVSDVFRRAEVWEVWDKERREVLFIAPEHPDQPLSVQPDPLRLEQFFPVVRPFQPVEVSSDLCPIEPYRLYRRMAEELEELTRRIQALVKAIRWRGAYNDPQIGDFLAKFENLDDGHLAPLPNPRPDADMMKAFWFQPIREAAEVLIRLYEAREQTKNTIYEITGIADLLRGQSMASETATAQNIKAQWGSLRVQTMQAEIQRVIRDVLRLKVELIAEHFSPQMLMMASGMQLTPEAIATMKQDPLRRFRVDIETDSTIRADLQRQQQNISGFVTGLGTFLQAVAPAVQAGAIPMEVAKTMLGSFARVFKLGRAVEEAMDQIPSQMPAQADPNAAAEQQAQLQAQAEQMREQGRQQTEQAKLAAAAQTKQMEIEAQAQYEAARLQFEMQKHADMMAIEERKLALEAASRAADHETRAAEFDAARERDEKEHELTERNTRADAVAKGVRFGEDGRVMTQDDMAEESAAPMREEMAATMARVAAAIEQATKALSAPKRIVRDQRNVPVGIEPTAIN